jgi:hypothetical protein
MMEERNGDNDAPGGRGSFFKGDILVPIWEVTPLQIKPGLPNLRSKTAGQRSCTTLAQLV